MVVFKKFVFYSEIRVFLNKILTKVLKWKSIFHENKQKFSLNWRRCGTKPVIDEKVVKY